LLSSVILILTPITYSTRAADLVFAQEETSFDHSLYAGILDKFLKNGLVDYRALSADKTALEQYLNKIATLEPGTLKAMSDNEKKAFYINTYNAFTLKAVIDHYPVLSIKKIPGVWHTFKFKIAGSTLSLSNIEHKILRERFKDPRVHFALVCASLGCPELSDQPYTGKELNAQLNKQTREFIQDPTKVRLNQSRKTLYLSNIFKWYEKDFGDLHLFVSRYLPEDKGSFIRTEKPKIKYVRYDWSLNKQ